MAAQPATGNDDDFWSGLGAQSTSSPPQSPPASDDGKTTIVVHAKRPDTAPPAANDDDFWQGLGSKTETPPEAAPYNPIHEGAVNAWETAKSIIANRNDPAAVHKAMEPTPGTYYADVLPYAETPDEAKAGKFHLALPNMLRGPLDFLLSGDPLAAGTVDPTKGTYGADPNALGGALMLAGPAGAIGNPLRFGGPMRFGEVPYAPLAGVNPVKPSVLQTAEARDITLPEGPAPRLPTDVPTPSTPPAGGPQAAGAQVTPAASAARTAREISHGNTVADEEWLNTPQQPGVRDTRILVEGNTPTLAEQEQSVATSRELKRLRGESTEVSQEERELLNEASENRKTAFKQAVPSDLTLDTQAKAAGDKIQSDLKTVWANKGTADVDPVKAQIDTELSGSAGHLPPMKSAMKQVSDSLEAAGTDPQELYKTHTLLNYLQSKQGKLENPGYGDAQVQTALTRVKHALAGKINDAAPGFSDAMKTYSDAIGPINAARALNKEYKDLFNKDGYMDFGSVHRLMKDVIDAGHPDAPTNDLAGISDFQLQTLKDIHDDLKRSTAAQNLAKAYGSDTAQNILDIVKGVGKTAGAMGVRGAAGWMFGPGGVIATDVGGRILGGIRANIASRAQTARGREILRPPPPPQNPLGQ